MNIHNCAFCGKPLTVEAFITGNPKIYHLDCAMEMTKEVREEVVAKQTPK